MRTKIFTLTVAAAALASNLAIAADGDRVHGSLAGDNISGTVTMLETASGVVLVEIDAGGLPEGEHGFHVHEVGQCDGENGFKSAGGHLARGLDHGIMSQNGPHPGDMPNLHVGSGGIAKADVFVRGFTLGRTGNQRILDDDGSAVIIHAGPDDYSTQPSGDAGDRLACAVLEPAE